MLAKLVGIVVGLLLGVTLIAIKSYESARKNVRFVQPAPAYDLPNYESALRLDPENKGSEIVKHVLATSNFQSVHSLKRIARVRINSSDDGEKSSIQTLLMQQPGRIRIDDDVTFVTKSFLPKAYTFLLLSNGKGWIKGFGNAREASPEEVEDFGGLIARLPGIVNFWTARGYGFRLETDQVREGCDCYVLVSLDPAAKRIVGRVWIAKNGFLILRIEQLLHPRAGAAGITRSTLSFSDYRKTLAGMVAFRRIETVDSASFSERTDMEVLTFEPNVSIPEAAFGDPSPR